jgi:hypothetical protein
MSGFATYNRGDIAPLCSAPPLARCLESELSDNFAALCRTRGRFASQNPQGQIISYRQRKTTLSDRFSLAERARFELAVSCPTTVFKTVTINHSVTSPYSDYSSRLTPVSRELSRAFGGLLIQPTLFGRQRHAGFARHTASSPQSSQHHQPASTPCSDPAASCTNTPP